MAVFTALASAFALLGTCALANQSPFLASVDPGQAAQSVLKLQDLSIPALLKSPHFRTIGLAQDKDNGHHGDRPQSTVNDVGDGAKHHSDEGDSEHRPDFDSSSSSSGKLFNFQLHEPAPLLSVPGKSCEVVLVNRSFANSYGSPSVFEYSPDVFNDTVCRDASKWTGLTLTIAGVSQGRQFDRLGTVWLGNSETGHGVEVWRHDNPEPTQTGIYWNISKDVSEYFALLDRNATGVFDFPNIVDRVYTGPLNVTLTLTASVDGTLPGNGTGNGSVPAIPLSKQQQIQSGSRIPDLLVPLSKQERTKSSLFVLGGPESNGTSLLKMPAHTSRAIVKVVASGTAAEEFWYNGVPDEFFSHIPNATEFGIQSHGPYREVQLWIDGRFAGFVTPYPVIFTGGINPLLWRPAANFGTFDQPAYTIDVTPFLGLLTDDMAHNFTLSMSSAEKEGVITANSWFVSGAVHIWLDPSGKRTTGSLLTASNTSHVLGKSTGQLDGVPTANGSLTYTTKVPKRLFWAAGKVVTGSQGAKVSTWFQTSAFSNTGLLNATSQINTQLSSGWSRSASLLYHKVAQMSEDQLQSYITDQTDTPSTSALELESTYQEFSYPLYANAYLANTTFNARVTQTFHHLCRSWSRARSTVSGLAKVARKANFQPQLPVSLPSSTDELAIPSPFPKVKTSSLTVHRNSSADAFLVNGFVSPGPAGSLQSFDYQDHLGNTITRVVATTNSTVVRDDLGGSIAHLAQPAKLV
ncbi:hypothetical protein BCV70DRAFT_157873 [Testicularia cyperi]|uniref:Peptide N-acetyl-beta-D-glucosaminyl asparaginase amidase A N-terminal domain-containing protein n=1 Tax=Testicularia cyperi TaxID=1882483 RepID=A0A317XWF3_9BASI|nr:hypothetical protein BCV70DRAFT_157873 [Testicularia cyperi]